MRSNNNSWLPSVLLGRGEVPQQNHYYHQYKSRSVSDEGSVTVVVVCCGEERLEETVTMIKSVASLTSHSHRHRLNFVIFSEDEQQRGAVRAQLSMWPSSFLSSMGTVSTRLVEFPSENADEWKALFKKCASQRLYLPSLLPSVGRLLYVDTDVLLMTDIFTDIWSHWSRMSQPQPQPHTHTAHTAHTRHMCALAPEHEDASAGWYNRFARHPYYGKLGVNSGVMLMDLDKMRVSEWSVLMPQYYKTYRYNITWGDQDLINIYFHHHPHELYTYDCSYNYRPDHCMYMPNCVAAHTHGVRVLHGSRRVWHDTDKQPIFRAVYNAWKQYVPGRELRLHLLEPMRRMINESTQSTCAQVSQIFTKHLEETINALSTTPTPSITHPLHYH